MGWPPFLGPWFQCDLHKANPLSLSSPGARDTLGFTLCSLFAFKNRTLVNPHESGSGGAWASVTKQREVQGRGEYFWSLGERGVVAAFLEAIKFQMWAWFSVVLPQGSRQGVKRKVAILCDFTKLPLILWVGGFQLPFPASGFLCNTAALCDLALTRGFQQHVFVPKSQCPIFPSQSSMRISILSFSSGGCWRSVTATLSSKRFSEFFKVPVLGNPWDRDCLCSQCVSVLWRK